MEFFATDEEVSKLDLLIKHDPHDLSLQVALAWQLRQRDCARALHIADTCQAQLHSDSNRQHHAWHLRLLLVRAECAWLAARLDCANDYAQTVLQECQSGPGLDLDPDLECDAWCLLAWLHLDRGQGPQRDQCWHTMRERAAKSDAIRPGFAEAVLAVMTALRSPSESEHLCRQYLACDLNQVHPALAAVIYDFLAAHTRLGYERVQAIGYLMRVFDKAGKTGQMRRAIIAAINVSNLFANLNEQNMAMEWAERSLAMARKTNWPVTSGACLSQITLCLHYQDQLDAAQDTIEEALRILQGVRTSRYHAIALWYQGDLALTRMQYGQALEAFASLQERAMSLHHNDLLTTAHRGQAHALAMLGRYEEALETAGHTLQIAQQQQDVQNQIAALRLLATIYRKTQLPPPPDMREQHPVLHYLLQALQLAGSVEAYIIPADLLDEIAGVYAAVGHYEAAFAYARQANEAREKSQLLAASDRAHALQEQELVERAQAESEHLRLLAEAESRRAQILHDTSSTLTHLGAIGQEITAQLDLDAIFAVLKNHVAGLLDASYFAIFLYDADRRSLHSIFRHQEGVTLPPLHIDADNQLSYAAQCLREQKELLVLMRADEDSPSRLKDIRPTHSSLFGPLTTGQRTLGVMTIQSESEDAYAERERLIFRNLCAYGAIALHNANAYRQLLDTQQQLVAQEKLASLGTLVAGVAHELNTPLGNSLMVGSELQNLIEDLDGKLQNKALSLSSLQTHVTEAGEAQGILMRGLQHASRLVHSFKQVAVDRTSEQWRPFDLQQTLEEILATLANRIRAAGHQLNLETGGRITMHSYPGALGEVVMNLVNNALLHAYENTSGGKMLLSARAGKAGRVEISFSDDGCGIAPQDLKHIFDPFFTTRLGQGGNGLGLSVSYNIITSLLGGKVQVRSTLGQGTTFILDLPQSVPANQERAAG